MLKKVSLLYSGPLRQRTHAVDVGLNLIHCFSDFAFSCVYGDKKRFM